MANFRSKNKPLRTFKPKERSVPSGLHDMVIERLSDDGRGIAKINSKTVFVKGALVGEKVRANYSASHKNFDEAECHNVIVASPVRVDPECQYFDACGGCTLQQLKYADQLQHKLNRVKRVFSSVVAQEDLWQLPISHQHYGYRHRARLAVKATSKEVLVGFRRGDSHDVVAINHCAVMYPSLSEQLIGLSQLIASLQKRSAVDELSIAEDSVGQQGIIIHCKQALADNDLTLVSNFARDKSIVIEVVTQLKNNPPQLQSRFGDTQLLYCLPQQQLKLPFSLSDFTQINPAINDQLLLQAIEWLDLSDDDTVADFFCGIGNFTLAIAQQAKQVIGYEMVSSMVAKAVYSTDYNHISNAVYKQQNLMNESFKLNNSCNKVLLDPPRAGAESLCKKLASSTVEKIVYISCNPQTLLRDCEHLLQGNYQLSLITMADMFPHTNHIELIALFSYTG